jgi:hypothetical protein
LCSGCCCACHRHAIDLQALKDLYSVEELLPSLGATPTIAVSAVPAPAASPVRRDDNASGNESPPSLSACVDLLESRSYRDRLAALYGLLHHCGGECSW